MTRGVVQRVYRVRRIAPRGVDRVHLAPKIAPRGVDRVHLAPKIVPTGRVHQDLRIHHGPVRRRLLKMASGASMTNGTTTTDGTTTNGMTTTTAGNPHQRRI